jgi:hypothetical protein
MVVEGIALILGQLLHDLLTILLLARETVLNLITRINFPALVHWRNAEKVLATVKTVVIFDHELLLGMLIVILASVLHALVRPINLVIHFK